MLFRSDGTLVDSVYDHVLAWHSALLEEGIYVIGFFYPVVAQRKARIRVQLSAAHTDGDVDRALRAFEDARAAANA